MEGQFATMPIPCTLFGSALSLKIGEFLFRFVEIEHSNDRARIIPALDNGALGMLL